MIRWKRRSRIACCSTPNCAKLFSCEGKTKIPATTRFRPIASTGLREDATFSSSAQPVSQATSLRCHANARRMRCVPAQRFSERSSAVIREDALRSNRSFDAACRSTPTLYVVKTRVLSALLRAGVTACVSSGGTTDPRLDGVRVSDRGKTLQGVASSNLPEERRQYLRENLGRLQHCFRGPKAAAYFPGTPKHEVRRGRPIAGRPTRTRAAGRRKPCW